MEKITLLIFGRSGSGKGTQAKLLKKNLDFDFHITTGSLLRKEAEKDSFIAKKIKKVLEDGMLCPAWVSSHMWERFLIEEIETNKENIIFDGVARRLEEAKYLDSVMEWFGREIIPIHINITENEAVKRLKSRGRVDDTDEDIENRMHWYRTEVMRVFKYYKNEDRLIEIDGMSSIEEVYENLLTALNSIDETKK
ncbi:MAG: nucleoside monophosphate kinase [Candidatus Paceibacterota bacterium]